MEPTLSGRDSSEVGNTSAALYVTHNLETVAEECEDDKKANNDLKLGVLVEDSTKSQLSKYLARLLQHFTQRYQHEVEISSFDLLFMVIYCLALETGFIPEGHVLEDAQGVLRPGFDRRLMHIFSAIVPSNLYDRVNRSYRLDVYLPGIEDNCALVGIKSGDFLCLTFTILQRSDMLSQSILLPVSRYIPIINFQKLNISCQNLKDLSCRVKNNIFIPIRDALCQASSPSLYPSLIELPDEVLVILLVKYLDRRSIMRLGASCSRLKMLTDICR
ncbi:uncharacterized protein LOC129768175 [Toxorhynchites rutilus septentrionalis]|uniref:uncharacterized protein LOC129768175 n=1 Tax=Toxorhynchites rutilus septentrionalis TaxID=329112 RepID=UPI00247B030C|nr:uncharacterized protein LOC129768175 [Toxorhynchites rutilus septentrionalis]